MKMKFEALLLSLDLPNNAILKDGADDWTVDNLIEAMQDDTSEDWYFSGNEIANVTDDMPWPSVPNFKIVYE